MKVKVKYFTFFREIADKNEEELSLERGANVQAALSLLTEKYPKFSGLLYDRKGKLNEHIKLMVNGKNIEWFSGLATKLKEKDVLQLFPPIGGG